jgi:hypothetical protein
VGEGGVADGVILEVQALQVGELGDVFQVVILEI